MPWGAPNSADLKPAGVRERVVPMNTGLRAVLTMDAEWREFPYAATPGAGFDGLTGQKTRDRGNSKRAVVPAPN